MTTGWEGIVKVQRSIVSTAREQCLIYDEHRKNVFMQTKLVDSPAAVGWFKSPHELKFYAKARIEKGELKLLEKVPDQPW